MIPVGLRYYFKRELASVADVESATEALQAEEEEEDTILAEGPRAIDTHKGKAAQLIMLSDDESDEYSIDESDEDVILEAGPALVIKADDNASSTPSEQNARDLSANHPQSQNLL